MSPSHQSIETTILALCLERGPGKTICPSEAARAIKTDESAWRALMPEIRAVAQRLAREGKISIYRKGEPIPDHSIAGLIRLGLPQT